MRLIDGDALERVLDMIPCADIKNIDGQAYVLVRLSQVFNIVKNAPTIEPDPCEDAISRKDAIDALEQKPHYYDGKDCVEQNYDDRMTIMKLPSVTPKRKTGEWIEVQYRVLGGHKFIKSQRCSKCGKIKDKYVTWNFCPNCGKDMRKRINNVCK